MGTYKDYIDKVFEINQKKECPPLCYLHSFGCQQNVIDGERITGILVEMGYGVTNDLNNADIIIYNTCAVRENAELKVFGNLGELKHLKERNPDLVIGLCGCMAQEKQVVEKILHTYKQVDLIFGTFAVEELPRLLYNVLTERKVSYDINDTNTSINEEFKAVRQGTIKAGVPIMYGCNNFCSYCIVPYVRGRERSRKPEAVVKEVTELANQGYKEIMLLGQNVNSYGKVKDENFDNPDNTDFPQLLRLINEIDGDFKIRFMSSHPKDATKELIDAIVDCEKVCKHLHLPVQSGSDRVLRDMNRHYTAEQYLQIVDYARSRIPDFSFSTDIIVGFPNETDEEFLMTIDILKRVEYDNVYSFIYSKRSGTKASLIEDSISYEEKTKRMKVLLDTQREIADRRYKRFLGKTLEVLFDAESKTKGYISGKSDEFIIVESKADSGLIGQRKKVLINKTMNWAVQGEIID